MVRRIGLGGVHFAGMIREPGSFLRDLPTPQSRSEAKDISRMSVPNLIGAITASVREKSGQLYQRIMRSLATVK